MKRDETTSPHVCWCDREETKSATTLSHTLILIQSTAWSMVALVFLCDDWNHKQLFNKRFSYVLTFVRSTSYSVSHNDVNSYQKVKTNEILDISFRSFFVSFRPFRRRLFITVFQYLNIFCVRVFGQNKIAIGQRIGSESCRCSM